MYIYTNIMNSSRTFFSALECCTCGQSFNATTIQTFCPTCNVPLLAGYDLESAKKIPRDTFKNRVSTLWRYRELLPVFDDAAIVTLGEGMTPLLRASSLGESLGLENLCIKDESFNPTGSFKARGIALAVSKAKELGVKEVCMPSAGNAGGALAAYAAKAGMKAHVFVPKDTPIINIEEVSAYGANVYLVDGVISDAAKLMNEKKKGTDWFDMSTMKEPYRLEGKKTMGYELAEQFNWELPDIILYPTGGGTGLIGMWKAFSEMEEMGWISSKKPRMVSVQAEGCAPIVKAFNEKKMVSEFWNHAQTIASGLRVPKAFADGLILQALYESKGTAIAVTDESILREMKRVAAMEGIILCPEGAATIAALPTLLQQGFIQHGERVVAFNTGSGYKYVELLHSLAV